jgi:predicted porin
MKKLTQHIPILMTFACTSVFAQNTVTLYGILSEGIGWTSNEAGHSNVKVFTGPNQNNRVGFRVTEDLGGGNRVVGVLENGFDIASGKFQQGGRMFGRQAYVGLSSNSYLITLFRDMSGKRAEIYPPFTRTDDVPALQRRVWDGRRTPTQWSR